MVIEGADYAFSVPSPAALVAAGRRFVVRYGGPGSASKQLTAGELAGLKSHGIDVVANAEGAAGGFRGTAAGKSWAQQAADHFGALGMPDGRPIYFSVDWDAAAADWADIDAALRGAASVIGAAQVGVYGSYDTIAHCSSARTAAWFWQTYAWSGGRWHPACHLQQYHNGVTIGGADCDLTRAVVADYGQWGFVQEEADVSQADVVAGLQEFFGYKTGASVASTNPDGKFESMIGKQGWGQPVPNTLRSTRAADGTVTTPRTSAWQLLVDIASVVGATPTADDNAQALLKALGGPIIDPQQVAVLLRTVLGDQAAAVGALLAS